MGRYWPLLSSHRFVRALLDEFTSFLRQAQQMAQSTAVLGGTTAAVAESINFPPWRASEQRRRSHPASDPLRRAIAGPLLANGGFFSGGGGGGGGGGGRTRPYRRDHEPSAALF